MTVARDALPRASRGRRAIVGAAWALAWMLAWSAALALFATKSHAQSPMPMRVPVSAPLVLGVSDGPVSLPIYVAEAHGLFKEEGVAVKLLECRSGRECYRALTADKVDVATASELVVALGSATRPDMAILATISASSYQIKLVARRSARLSEAPQIRGKRVATVAGSSAQYFLDNWLVFNDIDPKSVTVVPKSPEAIVAALEQRDVDAVAIWEPLAATAAAALGGEALTFSSPRVYTQHFNLVAARATIARREPELVKLLRVLIRAQRLIAADPAGAARLLAERLHVPQATAAKAMSDQDFRVRLDQSLVTTMDSQARWALHASVDNGGTHGIDLLHVIEPGPLRKAAPDAVGLVQ